MLNTDNKLDALAAEAEGYALSTFGLRLDLEPVAPTHLSHFLLDRYRLWQGSLLGQPMLLAAWRNWRPRVGFTTDFVKHREMLRRALDASFVILLLDPAPAAIRRQMVERRIGFLAPGTQFYVPEALLDFRERGRRVTPPPREHISPTAQLLLVAALLGEQLEDANLTELADRFNVAVMSISRALGELEALGIAEARPAGRQRRFHLLARGRDLWGSVEDKLQSPVRKLRMIRGQLDDRLTPRAGETALAQYTMIASPRIERRAIAALRWRDVASRLEVLADGAFEDDRIELESWSYDPAMLARDGAVDPISLYLSVRDDPDERVQQAADQLLELMQW